MMPQFTQEESPDSQIAWKVGHTALRIFAQLCSVHEVSCFRLFGMDLVDETGVRLWYICVDVWSQPILSYALSLLQCCLNDPLGTAFVCMQCGRR